MLGLSCMRGLTFRPFHDVLQRKERPPKNSRSLKRGAQTSQQSQAPGGIPQPTSARLRVANDRMISWPSLHGGNSVADSALRKKVVNPIGNHSISHVPTTILPES